MSAAGSRARRRVVAARVASGFVAWGFWFAPVAASQEVPDLVSAVAEIDARLEAGDADAALEGLTSCVEALAANTDLDPSEVHARVHALFRGLYARRDYPRALAAATLHVRVHEGRSSAAERVELSRAHNDVGLCLRRLGRYPESEAAHRMALSGLREVPGCTPSDDEAIMLENLGRCLAAQRQDDEAAAAFAESVAVLRVVHGSGANERVVQGIFAAATALFETGQMERALPYFEEYVAMRRALAGTDDLLVAKSYKRLADYQRALGLGRSARENYDRSLEIREALAADAEDIAVAIGDVASCLFYEGRVTEALRQFERALALHRSASDGVQDLRSRAYENSIAMCLEKLGLYGEAVARYQTIREGFEGAGNEASLGTTLVNLAVALDRAGRPVEAVDALDEAMELFRVAYGDGPHPTVANALTNQGRVLAHADRWEKAEQCFRESLAMFRALLPTDADHPSVARALGNTAVCLARIGENDAARSMNLEALEMRRRLYGDIDYSEIVENLGNLGQTLLALGRDAEAVDVLEDAAARAERIRTGASGLGAAAQATYFDELKRGGVFDRLAEALVRTQRPEVALAVTERAKSRELLDRLARTESDPMEDAIAIARQDEDVVELERLQRLEADIARADREHSTALRQIMSLAEDHATSPERRAAVLAEARTDFAETARIGRELRREIGRVGRSSALGTSPVSAAKIQAILSDDEALLEYAGGEPNPILFVVTRDEVRAHRLEVDQGELAVLVDRMLRIVANGELGSPTRGTLNPAAQARPEEMHGRSLFHHLVPEDVWALVRDRARVFVVPHGALHRLPFEALVVGGEFGAPRYWLDDGPPIAFVPSASVLRQLREDRGSRPAAAPASIGLLAIGDPDLDPSASVEAGAALGSASRRALLRAFGVDRLAGLGPLPGARREASEIAAMVAASRGEEEAVLLVGPEATESALFELATRARQIHLAAHGLAEELDGVSLSMVLLAGDRADAGPGGDGLLTLTELLSDWRGRLRGTECVVLSACRTNVGPQRRDDAPEALPLGFLGAGSRSVISTLWSIHDESTAEIMTGYYARSLAGERDRLAAFTAARRDVRKRRPNPFHWGAFRYTGVPE